MISPLAASVIRGKLSVGRTLLSIGFNSEKKDDVATTNISFNKNKSSSDCHSVVEQSGIKAGEGGFEINVKN
ncbi:hypothetical protein [Bartonella queenslandensis]|uniref:hypothetical protein n=1 Tax=Bartonella queenslandensis TaxID=481138 RepID=UPI001FCB54E4|nr:hypothetical protein [Bartonella queenslandensis]